METNQEAFVAVDLQDRDQIVCHLHLPLNRQSFKFGSDTIADVVVDAVHMFRPIVMGDGIPVEATFPIAQFLQDHFVNSTSNWHQASISLWFSVS